MADDLYRNPPQEFSATRPAFDVSRVVGRGRAPSVPLEFRERQQTETETDHAWRRKLEDDKFEIGKMTAQAQRDAAKLRAAEIRLNILDKQTAIRQKDEEVNHAIAAMEEFNALDYKDGAFPNRVADVYRRNPRALDNVRVGAFADKLLGMHETYLKDFRTDAQSDIEREAAVAAAAAAKGAAQVPTRTTIKTGGVTQEYEAPGATKTGGVRPIPVGIQSSYAKTLGELSGLYEKRKAKPDDKDVQAAITGNEELVRALKELHPDLGAPAAKAPPASAPPISAATPNIAPAQTPTPPAAPSPKKEGGIPIPADAIYKKSKSTGKVHVFTADGKPIVILSDDTGAK